MRTKILVSDMHAQYGIFCACSVLSMIADPPHMEYCFANSGIRSVIAEDVMCRY